MNLKILPLSFKSHVLVSNDPKTKQSLRFIHDWYLNPGHAILDDIEALKKNGIHDDVFVYATESGESIMRTAENKNGKRVISELPLIHGCLMDTYDAIRKGEGVARVYNIDKNNSDECFNQYLI